MTTFSDTRKILKEIMAVHPNFQVSDETVVVWQRLLSRFSLRQLEAAVREALMECPKPPTPKDIKDRIPAERAEDLRFSIQQDLAYHKAQQRKGFIKCEWLRSNGEKLYEWLPKRWAQEITGYYTILGERFELGKHPSMESASQPEPLAEEALTRVESLLHNVTQEMEF